MSKEFKIRTKNNDLFLRVQKGHFATMHSHTNYYIDVTTQKMRLSEAKALAEELVAQYKMTTIVDTILCIDGMEVVGTCIAEELTRDEYVNMNAHQTIYIVSPEYITGGQMMFRDNIVPMLQDKHVLIVAASVTTGKSALAHAELEAIGKACETLGGWRLWQCELYVTLEPCPMCAGAIINSRLRRVVYGASDSKAGSCGSVVNLFDLPYNHRPEVVAGFMGDECGRLLTEFFREMRHRRKKERKEYHDHS